MSGIVFIEGGGNSKDLHIRCRNGFRKLFDKCGVADRMPRLVSRGGREATFESFIAAHRHGAAGFVAMLVDSEDPLSNVESAWAHLAARDGWKKPKGAHDEQVLFMTTCMETWIVADRQALSRHYGKKLQKSALPPLSDLESRPRANVQAALSRATKNCGNCYAKGRRSFDVLTELTPEQLNPLLPSFRRVVRILRDRLTP